MGVGTWREVHGWPPPCPVPPLNDPFSRLRGLSCAVEGLHLNGKTAKVLAGKNYSVSCDTLLVPAVLINSNICKS